MGKKIFGVSVLEMNTHSAHPNYYGPPRANMVAYPIPQNIRLIKKYIDSEVSYHQNNKNKQNYYHIIMLPEFILQPREGAYNGAQRAIVLAHLQNILNRLPSYIVVMFGTIVSDWTNMGIRLISNEMPYGRGTKNLRFVPKLHVSGIDLFSDTANAVNDNLEGVGWALIAGQNRLCQSQAGLHGNPQWSPSPAPKPTVKWDNVLFGISICLDYAQGVLRNMLHNAGRHNRHIHLVSSCGMRFMPQNLGVNVNYVVENGSVVVCDALGNWSEITKCKANGSKKVMTAMTKGKVSFGGVLRRIKRGTFSINV